MKPPFFKFFAFDFVADGFQRSLRPDEAGVYIRLLAQQWIDGGLRDDSRILRTLAGCDCLSARAWRRIESRMREVFVACGDGQLRHPKLDELQGQVAGASPSAATGTAARSDLSARMSALAQRRWGRSDDAPACEPACESDATRNASPHAAGCGAASVGDAGCDAGCDAALARDSDSDSEKIHAAGARVTHGASLDASPHAHACDAQCEPACESDATRNAAGDASPHAADMRRRVMDSLVAHVHRADRAGSTLAPQPEPRETVCEIALTLAREAQRDAVQLAVEVCDAYDAYRAACSPGRQPPWRADAIARHRDRIQRIVLGIDPRPSPWQPGQPPPSGRPRREPGVAPVPIWDENSKYGLIL